MKKLSTAIGAFGLLLFPLGAAVGQYHHGTLTSGNRFLCSGFVVDGPSALGIDKALDRQDIRTPAPDSNQEFEVQKGMYNVFALSSLLIEPEIYHDVARHVPQEIPVIENVQSYRSEGPPGVVESGTLVKLVGKNLDSATQIILDGKSITPLMVATDHLVARLEGLGSSNLQITTAQGFTSSPMRVLLIQVTPERVPPRRLQVGQVEVVVLRIEGTSDAIEVAFNIDSDSVSFLDRTKGARVSSSGGSHNVARATIKALQAGAFNVTYRLASREPGP